MTTRTHEDRAAAIAKAELKYLRERDRTHNEDDVTQAAVHGDRVFLFGAKKRVLAVYAVTWGRYRVDVVRDLNWEKQAC